MLKIKPFMLLAFLQFLPALGKTADSTSAHAFITSAKIELENARYSAAMENFDEAAKIWLTLGNGPQYLECQSEIGRMKFLLGKFSDGIKILHQALDKSSSLQCDSSGQIGVINSLLGYGYAASDNLPNAELYGTIGVKLCEAKFGYYHEKTGSAYYVLGTVLKEKGDYPTALIDFYKAKEIQSKVLGEYSRGYAATTFAIGVIFDNKNDFDQALQYYQNALTIFDEIGKSTLSYAASCHLYMMSCYNNKGDYHTALEHGKKVLEIYTVLSLPEHPNVASTYGKLGEIYSNLGDYEKAKEYFLRTLSIFSTRYPENKSADGDFRIRLANIYSKTGECAKAIEYAEKGILSYRQSFGEYHPEIGFHYELVANIYCEAKQYTDALKYYQKAIAARNTITDSISRNDIASLYSSIASVYLQQHQFDSAFVYLQRSLAIEQCSKEINIPQSALLQERFGNFYSLKSQFPQALRYYQNAIEIVTSTNAATDLYTAPHVEHSYYKKELLSSIEQKARTFEMLYHKNRSITDLQAALIHFQAACNVVDDARKQYSSDASKIFFAQKSSVIYRQACKIAVMLFEKTKDPKYKEAAFLIADRSKGNILLEKLFDGEAKSFAGIPDSLLTYERELQRAITFCETQMLHSGEHGVNISMSSTSDLQAQHFELTRKHQQLSELLERQYPKYYELKYARYSLSLKQVQKNIPAASVMVEYMIDDSVIYAFTLSNKNLTIRIIKNTSTTGELVQQFSTALKTYNTEGYCSAGYTLYSKLLQPLEKEIGTSSIVIIPDGYLYYIPFEALPTQRYSPGTIDFTKLRYVISTHDITYSYSAAFDLKMNERMNSHSSVLPSFAGFAPVFRDSIKNGDFFANRSSVEESGLSDVRSITLDGKKFNELKYSEDELLSIGNTFNGHSLSAKNFLNTDATEKNFKEFSRTADIVHIATHGFFNEKNPKLSAIIFSQPKELSTDGEDGILYVDETFNLDLKAQLVVLSSCESGVGKLVDGEGMIALSRGLFYAGAQNIIYSLWKVSDKQTYLLMDEFYKNVVKGKSYSSSLRSAKLSLISSKESAFPSKWSGFVLVGK